MIRPAFTRFSCALVIFALVACLPTGAFAVPVATSAGSLADHGPDSFAPSGWTSSIYPRDWTAGYMDAQGRQVADFSYAGYGKGERPLPTLEGSLTVDVTQPPYSASPSGTVDVTDRIQAALDDVGLQGGGVVYLPAGIYRVSRRADCPASLVIRYDNVVLRGAGRGLTRVYNTTTSMRRASVISVQPTEAGSWAMPPIESMANLVADAPAGSREVQVTNPEDFEAGDLVVVRTEATDEWLAEHGNPRNWNAETFDATTYLRRVEEVRPDGTLLVDIPFRTDIRLRDHGTLANVFRARRHLTGVGVEDLSIGMRPHAANSKLLDETHESSAVRLRNVTDSWIRRVSSYKATSSSPYHLLSEGIWLDNCKSVSVIGCIMAMPQNRDAGNGNGYVIRGSDNLIDSCAAIQSRHSYSFGYVHATGNVLRRSMSARPLLSSDFHMWFSAVNLVEQMYLDGDAIDASFRADGANLIHGPTTSQSVIWNTRGVGTRIGAPAAPLVNSIQWGWGAVIGTCGTPSRVSYDPDIEGANGDRTIDLVEGVGHARTLLPHSLYQDQFRRRTTGDSANVLATGTAVFPSSERFVKRGTTVASAAATRPASLRSGDRELYTFDVRGLRRIERARIVFDARVGRSATAVSVRLLSGSSPMSASTTLARLNRTRNAPSTWVIDVSEQLRWRTATGAKTVTLEVVPTGSTPMLLRTSLDADPARRPRLEIETARSPEMSATVVPASAKSAAADGSIYTYYSRFARPSVTLDLGAVRHVDSVGVAFGGGDEHFDFADVWSSMDGAVWKPAGEVCGTGCTESIEVTNLDVPVDARYIRFTGIMSSRSDDLNRVTFRELEVYGN